MEPLTSINVDTQKIRQIIKKWRMLRKFIFDIIFR